MTNIRARRLLSGLTWLLPVFVLVTAFMVIAVYTGNWWPWFEVVHETGDRSLIGTVLYYQHAAREIPVDIVLGVAIGGSALWAFPGVSSPSHYRRGMIAVFLLIVLVVIVAGTLWTGGPAMLRDSLLQMHTRPGAPMLFGSHWRYHFLSRLILMLASFGLAGLTVVVLRGKHAAVSRPGQGVFLASIGLFVLLSMIFGLDSDPFLDTVFLGHQARELFTHGLVTVPLSWWFCLTLSRSRGAVADNGTASLALSLVAAVIGAFLGLYLFIGALVVSAQSFGQAESLVILIYPHYFEHAFSYLVVPLIAGLVYETGISVHWSGYRGAKHHNTHGTS